MSLNKLDNEEETNSLSDLEIELRDKVTLLGDEENQGEILQKKDYLTLWFVGIIIPIIILIIGWV